MSDNRIIECMERAQYLLGNLMAVKPGEEVLIVVDPQTDERMTQAMAAAALNCGARIFRKSFCFGWAPRSCARWS